MGGSRPHIMAFGTVLRHIRADRITRVSIPLSMKEKEDQLCINVVSDVCIVLRKLPIQRVVILFVRQLILALMPDQRGHSQWFGGTVTCKESLLVSLLHIVLLKTINSPEDGY